MKQVKLVPPPKQIKNLFKICLIELNHYNKENMMNHLIGDSSISEGEINEEKKNIERRDRSVSIGKVNTKLLENELTHNRSISLLQKIEKNRVFFGEDVSEQVNNEEKNILLIDLIYLG